MQVKKIEAYSLYEFCSLVQDAIAEGYKFDFMSNANFPTAFGSLLVCGMVQEVEDLTEDIENSPAKPGRRPKKV